MFFLLFYSGNSHDEMLLAKLETVYTGSVDRGSSMVSLPMYFYIYTSVTVIDT